MLYALYAAAIGIVPVHSRPIHTSSKSPWVGSWLSSLFSISEYVSHSPPDRSHLHNDSTTSSGHSDGLPGTYTIQNTVHTYGIYIHTPSTKDSYLRDYTYTYIVHMYTYKVENALVTYIS